MWLLYHVPWLAKSKDGENTAAVEFADNTALIVHGRTVEANVRVLTGLNSAGEGWARTHGTLFAVEKYD